MNSNSCAVKFAVSYTHLDVYKRQNLALWVGGFVLIAIYKLEVAREGIRRITATQAYLGRWLLLVTIGFLQAVIATIGDLVLGIQCEHPLLFILAGIFCSFVYINIIYALAVAFRHIGKAIAVILVIVQIPGASGLYPIEMMPNFFRELHPCCLLYTSRCV